MALATDIDDGPAIAELHRLHAAQRAAFAADSLNFPFGLSVGPLVEVLAAGNRVIIKPSDYTPACTQLLRQMVSETFP
jgi:acyl-CoA reductase-like NAD-dependent aldehyde dehydrogenase